MIRKVMELSEIIENRVQEERREKLRLLGIESQDLESCHAIQLTQLHEKKRKFQEEMKQEQRIMQECMMQKRNELDGWKQEVNESWRRRGKCLKPISLSKVSVCQKGSTGKKKQGKSRLPTASNALGTTRLLWMVP